MHLPTALRSPIPCPPTAVACNLMAGQTLCGRATPRSEEHLMPATLSSRRSRLDFLRCSPCPPCSVAHLSARPSWTDCAHASSSFVRTGTPAQLELSTGCPGADLLRARAVRTSLKLVLQSLIVGLISGAPQRLGLHTPSDCVCSARATGPFSRSPSSLKVVDASILAYTASYARACAAGGAVRSQ